MEYKTINEEYREFLNKLSIGDLRVLGRQIGVPKSTTLSKGALLTAVVEVLTGERQPVPRSKKGAPAKQDYIDPAIMKRIETIRKNYESAGVLPIAVSSNAPSFEPVRTGYLEIMPSGVGYIRPQIKPSVNDVFVSSGVITEQRLRAGDKIVCSCVVCGKGEYPEIAEIYSINGRQKTECDGRLPFDGLTAVYPDRRLPLGGEGDSLLRLLGLFAPIGKGQRAAFVVPVGEQTDTLFSQISEAVLANEEVTVLSVLLGARPEDITEEKKLAKEDVFYTLIGEGTAQNTRTAELAFRHAQRLAEGGGDVVILLNSLTALAESYQKEGKSSDRALQLFGCARNTREKGSITVIATVESRDEETVLSCSRAANCMVYCKEDYVASRLTIDIGTSATRRSGALLSGEETEVAARLREIYRNDPYKCYELLRKYSDNEALIAAMNDNR